MDTTTIITIVTTLVTLIMGFVVKKVPKISNKVIPIQNLLIAIIVTIAEWIITKDFNGAVLMSGLFAGGAYDLGKNLLQIINSKKGE